MNGIDISESQKYINLSLIECDFVIVKATEGKTYTDPCFFQHINNAKKLGKLLGFYHYARPENNRPEEEVQNFLNAVGSYLGEGIPFLDWESAGKYDVTWAKQWLDIFYQRTGIKPIIYMSVLSCEHAYNWSNVAPYYKLWIAKYKDYGIDYNYDMSDAGKSPVPKYWDTYVMWQWTSKGRLDGYGGDLDCDLFYGERAEWLKLCEKDIKPMSDYIEVRDGVATYSNSKQGNKTFTIGGKPSNFKVKEFACHDGTDEILIDGNLVRYMQRERDLYGSTTINSGYRDPAYNASIPGASVNSQHVKGKAADIVCRNGSPLEVAMTAEAMGMGGIGLYSGFTHIDTRDGKSRWDQRSGRQVGVSTFFKTIRFGSTGDYVKIAQRKLGLYVNGKFTKDMEAKVIDYQRVHGLVTDGIIGRMTWTELMK